MDKRVFFFFLFKRVFVFESEIHKSGTTSLDMLRTSHGNKARLATDREREQCLELSPAGDLRKYQKGLT